MMDRDHATPGAAEPLPGSAPVVMGVPGLQAIIDALRGQGFTVIGPTRRDGAIVLAEIAGVGDLPAGCGDEQDAAHYRLHQRDDEAFFGFAADRAVVEIHPVPRPRACLVGRAGRAGFRHPAR